MAFFLKADELRIRRVRQRVRALVDLAGDTGEVGGVPGKWAMITLTYHYDTWEPDHIADFMKIIRSWSTRRKFRLCYCWVAELQRRGVIHYHVLIKLPKGVKLPKPDESGWWRHGSTGIEFVRLSGKRYLSKYYSKETQKRGQYPRGARICGAGGLPKTLRLWYSWLLCPHYVKCECDPQDRPQRCRGGYRIRGQDNFFVPTPYVATHDPKNRGVWIEQKGYERRLEDYNWPGANETYLSRQSFAGAVDKLYDIEFDKWHETLEYRNPFKDYSWAGSFDVANR